MDIIGPSSATGGITALTREPSGRRASTMGLDSSMRRPTSETILSMMRSRCFSSVKVTLRQFQLAPPLHVDLVVGVDQDVRHRRVGHQQLQRAEAQHLVLDVADQRAPLGIVDGRLFLLQQALDHRRDLLAQLLGRERLQRGEVELVQQLQVDAAP